MNISNRVDPDTRRGGSPERDRSAADQRLGRSRSRFERLFAEMIFGVRSSVPVRRKDGNVDLSIRFGDGCIRGADMFIPGGRLISINMKGPLRRRFA